MAIDRLLIDPSNSSTMYAESARSGGVFKSTDGGLNWTAVHIPSDSYGIPGTYWTLALDPRNPTTIYAGSLDYDSDGGDLFKSTDGGTSWRRTPLRSNDGNGILDVVVDPQDTEVLYAGFPYHLYQSIDGGETWREATGFPSFGALSIAIDPQNPSILYVRTYTRCVQKHGSWKQLELGTCAGLHFGQSAGRSARLSHHLRCRFSGRTIKELRWGKHLDGFEFWVTGKWHLRTGT